MFCSYCISRSYQSILSHATTRKQQQEENINYHGQQHPQQLPRRRRYYYDCCCCCRSMLCKPLLIAQILSLLLAGSGAANASLHFECNVSAPILQAGMIYIGLAMYSLLFRGRVAAACCRFCLVVFLPHHGGGGGGTATTRVWNSFNDMQQQVVQQATQEMIPQQQQEEWNKQLLEEGRVVGRAGEDEQQQQQQQMIMSTHQSIAAAPAVAAATNSMSGCMDDSNATEMASSTCPLSAPCEHSEIPRNSQELELQPQTHQHKTVLSSSSSSSPNSTTALCHRRFFRVQYASLKLYAFMAFLDVEANYLIYLSFRYTTLTSVSLLDALAIPSAMVFSKLILRRRYRPAHVIGAAICIVGMVVNVLGDYNHDGGGNGVAAALHNSDSSTGRAGNDDGIITNTKDDYVELDAYPHKLRGDVLAMGGAILYGLNNVLTERVVKGANHVNEYLGVLGCFGTLYCAVQSLFLGEMDSLSFYFGHSGDDADKMDMSGQCHPSEMWMLWFASATLGVLSYTGMANFLAESEAALLNLSLLTGDLWAALFSVVAEQILPTVYFWMSLILIVVGVWVYEVAAPSPVEEWALDDSSL